MTNLEVLTDRLVAFREARGWEVDHTPRNLAEAITVEAGELLECFLWGEEPDRQAIRDEIADVGIYLLNLADVLSIDLAGAIAEKIERNAERFPVS